MRKGTKSIVRLEIPPQDKPIVLYVESVSDEINDHGRYYYEVHTCPTNYLRGVIAIIDGEINIDEDGNPTTDDTSDADPHGIATFEGGMLVTDELKASILDIASENSSIRNALCNFSSWNWEKLWQKHGLKRVVYCEYCNEAGKRVLMDSDSNCPNCFGGKELVVFE